MNQALNMPSNLHTTIYPIEKTSLQPRWASFRGLNTYTDIVKDTTQKYAAYMHITVKSLI